MNLYLGSITITTMGSGITGSTMVGRVLPATHIIDEDDVSLDDVSIKQPIFRITMLV